jgi:hypothetical protein
MGPSHSTENVVIIIAIQACHFQPFTDFSFLLDVASWNPNRKFKFKKIKRKRNKIKQTINPCRFLCAAAITLYSGSVPQ